MAAKWAEMLLKLQSMDLRMRDIRARLAMLPDERNKVIQRGRTEQARREEARLELKQTELDIKSAESEIARLNESAAKMRQQSASIKKNTEYQAMLGEIAGVLNKISALESTVIESMDKVEAQRRNVRDVTAAVEASIKGIKEELTELDAFVLELRAENARLEKEAADMSATIEGPMLERYRHLLKKGQGRPVVPIENGICSNCRLRVTPQTLAVIARGVLANCDNCMHLVYQEDKTE